MSERRVDNGNGAPPPQLVALAARVLADEITHQYPEIEAFPIESGRDLPAGARQLAAVDEEDVDALLKRRASRTRRRRANDD